MRDWIKNLIDSFIRSYEKNTITKWGSPIVGFADAKTAEQRTREIMPHHSSPFEIMEDASIIIAYYIPFLQSMADTNKNDGLASKEWAIAYEETNKMLGEINKHVISELENRGYKGSVHPESNRFDKEKLISNWSHRHIAYEAGLGTFGINNMLITDNGCCGRFSTVITNIDAVADIPQANEKCKYKANGKCGACMNRCPKGALSTDGFDREKCYDKCLENAAIYTYFGSSYTSDGEKDMGSEVCGKCVAGMPCAFL